MILNNLSLNVFQGETVGLLCFNDAAKNALVNFLTGKVDISSGRIYFNEKKITGFKRIDPISFGIFHIKNQPDIIPQLSVAENILLSRIHEAKCYINKKSIIEYAKKNNK